MTVPKRGHPDGWHRIYSLFRQKNGSNWRYWQDVLWLVIAQASVTWYPFYNRFSSERFPIHLWQCPEFQNNPIRVSRNRFYQAWRLDGSIFSRHGDKIKKPEKIFFFQMSWEPFEGIDLSSKKPLNHIHNVFTVRGRKKSGNFIGESQNFSLLNDRYVTDVELTIRNPLFV